MQEISEEVHSQPHRVKVTAPTATITTNSGNTKPNSVRSAGTVSTASKASKNPAQTSQTFDKHEGIKLLVVAILVGLLSLWLRGGAYVFGLGSLFIAFSSITAGMLLAFSKDMSPVVLYTAEILLIGISFLSGQFWPIIAFFSLPGALIGFGTGLMAKMEMSGNVGIFSPKPLRILIVSLVVVLLVLGQGFLDRQRDFEIVREYQASGSLVFDDKEIPLQSAFAVLVPVNSNQQGLMVFLLPQPAYRKEVEAVLKDQQKVAERFTLVEKYSYRLILFLLVLFEEQEPTQYGIQCMITNDAPFAFRTGLNPAIDPTVGLKLLFYGTDGGLNMDIRSEELSTKAAFTNLQIRDYELNTSQGGVVKFKLDHPMPLVELPKNQQGGIWPDSSNKITNAQIRVDVTTKVIGTALTP